MTSLSKYLFYKVLIAGNVYLVCIVLRSRERERESCLTWRLFHQVINPNDAIFAHETRLRIVAAYL